MSQTYTKSANKSTTTNENLSFLKEIYIPEPNYTQFPNILTDQVMRHTSGGEWKVLSAICRKTFGWHTNWKDISLSYLEKTTGLLKPAVISAINGLIEKGLIEKKKTGKTGCEKSWYKLVIRNEQKERKSPPQYLKKREILEEKKPSNNFDQYENHTGMKIIPNKERDISLKERYIKDNTEKHTPPSSAIIPSSKHRKNKSNKLHAKEIAEYQSASVVSQIGIEEFEKTKAEMLDWMSDKPDKCYSRSKVDADIIAWTKERLSKQAKNRAKKENTVEKKEEIYEYIEAQKRENPQIKYRINNDKILKKVELLEEDLETPCGVILYSDFEFKKLFSEWVILITNKRKKVKNE